MLNSQLYHKIIQNAHEYGFGFEIVHAGDTCVRTKNIDSNVHILMTAEYLEVCICHLSVSKRSNIFRKVEKINKESISLKIVRVRFIIWLLSHFQFKCHRIACDCIYIHVS